MFLVFSFLFSSLYPLELLWIAMQNLNISWGYNGVMIAFEGKVDKGYKRNHVVP